MYNKKGKMSSMAKMSFMVFIIVGAVLAVGFKDELLGLFNQTPPAGAINQPLPGEQPAAVPGATVSCPSGSQTNIKTQYEDTAASTETYANNIVSYAFWVSGGSSPQKVITLANTSSTKNAYSSATAAECNTKLPVVYRPIAVQHKKGDTTVYGYSSDVASDVTMAGATVFVDFKGKSSDILKATVKDFNNQEKYLNATDPKVGTSGTTGYAAINNSFTDQGGETSMTIGTDGYIDLEISVKTNNTRNVFGSINPRTGQALMFNGKALRTIVAIDADTTDWQEPSVSGGGITKISSADLAEDDRKVLSAYEYFYTVDAIKDTDTKFRWYMLAESGVNPSMDPKWRFCQEGIYLSSDEPNTFKVGCFDDSSSNNELAVQSAYDKQEIMIDIS